ncbi:KpsF/GutQ family sugar-phosphate isomerase [Woeseiaceae bacterium]|jgi:arabinose-5-phosphate isomerase|nr:KpsF/GutQ family sugar-phosphate isomerase [Woeseiaceae bacterium]
MKNKMTSHEILSLAREVMYVESDAIKNVADSLNEAFCDACKLILGSNGKLVTIGIGKSGHIARKISATLSSTGTSSFFINAADASHGDLGMISPTDIILAMSYSGETEELISLLPSLKKMELKLISITGNSNSSIAKASDTHILVNIEKEACPLNLAPTASTTASLAVGDALAATLIECRNFSTEDFAKSHPNGSLGKRLLLKVADIMHTGEKIPTVKPEQMLSEGLIEISQKNLGMVAIIDENKEVLGIFTDGDLRRTLDSKIDIHKTHMSDVMSTKYKTVEKDMLAIASMKLLKHHKITHLLVTNENKILQGALNIHDLLQAGIVRSV